MAKKTIKITFSWDPEEEHWVAASNDPPLAATAPRTELAEQYIVAALRRKLSTDFEIEIAFEFPKEIQDIIDAEQALSASLEELKAKQPLLRYQAASTLQNKFGMRQAEVANCFGITASYLGRIVAQVAQDQVEEATRKYTGSGTGKHTRAKTTKKSRP